MGSLASELIRINSILLLIYAVYLLMSNRGNTLLNRLLAGVFISRFALDFITLIFISKFFIFHSKLIFLIPSITFLGPACTYFYVRTYLKDESRLHKWDWLHFLPSLLVLVNMMPALLSSSIDANGMAIANGLIFGSSGNTNLTLFISLKAQLFCRIILTFLYFGFSWKILIQHLSQKSHQIIGAIKYWLLFFLIVGSLLLIIAAIGTAHLFITGNYFYTQLNRPLIALILIFLTISYMLYPIWQPVVLYGNISFPEIIALEVTNKIKEIKPSVNPSEKIERNIPLLTLEQIDNYIVHFGQFMEDKKPFLKADLNLALLARQLEMPEHHLTYVLNHILKQKFRDCINGYRIQHFIKEYPAKANDFTVDSFALMTGFNTKKTFYSAFTKETGQTPAAYFKS